jgi:transcriptional pleiotropic regulator of transition state genes
MKSTGIIRKVDNLGRIVLPVELRKNLNINIGDPLEIYVEDDNIILKKYHICICDRCNKRIDSEDKFCKYCGAEQEELKF